MIFDWQTSQSHYLAVTHQSINIKNNQLLNINTKHMLLQKTKFPGSFSRNWSISNNKIILSCSPTLNAKCNKNTSTKRSPVVTKGDSCRATGNNFTGYSSHCIITSTHSFSSTWGRWQATGPHTSHTEDSLTPVTQWRQTGSSLAGAYECERPLAE